MKKSLASGLILLLTLVSLLASGKGPESKGNKRDKTSRITKSAAQKLVANFMPETNEIIDSKVDQEGLKRMLLGNKIFTAVNDVAITIGDDEATGTKVAYFTIIGIGPSGDPLAYQCDLPVTGNAIYMPDPAAYEIFGTTHSCSGQDYSSCTFKKDKNGQIYGCNSLPGHSVCNHTITTTTKARGQQFGWELVYETYL